MKRSAVLVTVLPLVGVAYLLDAYARVPWTTARVVGLVLLIPALGLVTVARIQLGNSFSVTPQAEQLVTHGLYSRIRNPIYVFGIAVVAGLGLYLEQPALLVALVPVIILQITRARAEARVLEQRFGDAYRRYRAGTWF